MNIDTATLLVNISRISYLSVFDMDNEFDFAKEGYITYQPYFVDNLEAYLVEYQDVRILVFRGTDDLSDWKVNLNAIYTTSELGSVHKGFYEAYVKLWEEIKDNFVLSSDKPLYITGHSLGGALATIASVHFTKYNIPFVATYTYGQPKVFRESTIYVRKASQKLYRFFNPYDLVPRIPPLFTKYYHVGHPCYIDVDGILFTPPTFEQRITDYFWLRIKYLLRLAHIKPFTGYSTKFYLEKIKENAVLYREL